MSRASDLERGPLVVAARAAVVAEVADVGGRIDVRSAAADAELRVRSVLERRPGDTGVVEPEGDAARMRLTHGGELGVVGVVDELRLLREPVDGGAPALGHELELPVAIELVAEEVAEAHGPGTQPPHELRQRALVHLEQAEVGVTVC